MSLKSYWTKGPKQSPVPDAGWAPRDSFKHIRVYLDGVPQFSECLCDVKDLAFVDETDMVDGWCIDDITCTTCLDKWFELNELV